MNKLLKDEAATVEFGRNFLQAARELIPNRALVCYLMGDLGVGKTTFARGVVQAAGWQGAVKSPTYTLVEPYELNDVTINHFDLYRLAEPEELEYIGIRDYFLANSVSLIEWPTKGMGFLPHADIELHLADHGTGRMVELIAKNSIGEQLIERLG